MNRTSASVFQQLRANSTLIIKTFWGQIFGILITFIVPIVLTFFIVYLEDGLMSRNPGYQGIQTTLKTLEPGLLTLPTIMVGILGIPIVLSVLKETNILKKIKVMKMSSNVFFISLILTFLLIQISSSLLVFITSKVVWQSDAPNPNGAGFIIPYLLLCIMSISIGLLIGGMVKNSSAGFGISMGIFLLVFLISGILFPTKFGWLADASKVIPHSSLESLLQSSWVNGGLSLHDMPQYGDFILISLNMDTLFSYLYPSLFVIVSWVILPFIFKWE